MFSVLFVCAGNVCRSPFAERLLRHRLEEYAAGPRFAVESVGMRAIVDSPIHAAMAAELVARGVSPDDFAARWATPQVLSGADLMLAATRDLRSRALEDAPGALRRTFTIREFAGLLELTDPRALTLAELVRACAAERSRLTEIEYDIMDPIGREPEVFTRVAAELDTAVTAIASGLAATQE